MIHTFYLVGPNLPKENHSTHSHKAISPWRRGLRRDWEGAQQLLNQLAAFTLVINIPPTPCFVHREYTKPPVFTHKHLLFWEAAHSSCQIEQELIIFFYNDGSRRIKHQDLLSFPPLPEPRESGPPPDLVSLIPIRKTRAGLQFTCATPTLGPTAPQGLKDIWVCNSDGYVGQVRAGFPLFRVSCDFAQSGCDVDQTVLRFIAEKVGRRSMKPFMSSNISQRLAMNRWQKLKLSSGPYLTLREMLVRQGYMWPTWKLNSMSQDNISNTYT